MERAIELDGAQADYYVLRAWLALTQRRLEQVVADATACIAIEPENAKAHLLRAEANLGLGCPEATRDDIAKAIVLDPAVAAAWPAMDDLQPAWAAAAARGTQSETAETAKTPETPEMAEAEKRRTEIGQLVMLARRLAASRDQRYRDGPRAVKLATEACELSGWADARCLETLAAACAEAGDFAAAVRWQTKALEPSDGMFDDTARRRLRLYEARRPFREDLW